MNEEIEKTNVDITIKNIKFKANHYDLANLYAEYHTVEVGSTGYRGGDGGHGGRTYVNIDFGYSPIFDITFVPNEEGTGVEIVATGDWELHSLAESFKLIANDLSKIADETKKNTCSDTGSE